ncbi:hypothetical protein [Aquimarina sp. Aq78]|uniref:hypothetical protein n=1 Tax=Aquimarina sp. Aq78 TaxID=1191889 RepID=UPI000D10CB6B|nr:hypothetical protein [Aquimarina sp. Aq78]
MDSIFKTISAVAGIGGVSLGVLLIIFKEVIRKKIFPKLDRSQSYRIIRAIIFYTFITAIIGLVSYVVIELNRTNRPEPIVIQTNGDNSPALESSGSVEINYGDNEEVHNNSNPGK